ncbi:MAG: hypothetical protein HZA22_04585 [Nitrospirae bacterium]|nr:hypothetical protein [Nitrospirota bacterium]
MVSKNAERMAMIIRGRLVEFFAARNVPKAYEVGSELGREIEELLIKELGGIRLTIPCLKEANRAARDYCIFRDFTGANHEELALRHGISRKQVYNILRKRQLEFIF